MYFTISEANTDHNPFTEEKYATLGRVLHETRDPNSGPRQRSARSLHLGQDHGITGLEST